jgi:hypothetical protein
VSGRGPPGGSLTTSALREVRGRDEAHPGDRGEIPVVRPDRRLQAEGEGNVLFVARSPRLAGGLFRPVQRLGVCAPWHHLDPPPEVVQSRADGLLRKGGPSTVWSTFLSISSNPRAGTRNSNPGDWRRACRVLPSDIKPARRTLALTTTWVTTAAWSCPFGSPARAPPRPSRSGGMTRTVDPTGEGDSPHGAGRPGRPSPN